MKAQPSPATQRPPNGKILLKVVKWEKGIFGEQQIWQKEVTKQVFSSASVRAMKFVSAKTEEEPRWRFHIQIAMGGYQHLLMEEKQNGGKRP